MDKINFDDLDKALYTEKNMPHPKGPRSQRRHPNKARCKRLRETRNKLICGGSVICWDMKRHGKKVRELLQNGVINPKLIMRVSGMRQAENE